jgi:hypothetical protein
MSLMAILPPPARLKASVGTYERWLYNPRGDVEPSYGVDLFQ